MIVLNFCKKMCYKLLWSEDSSSIFYQDIFFEDLLYKECSQDLSKLRYLKGFLKFMQGSSKIFTKIHNDLQGSSKILPRSLKILKDTFNLRIFLSCFSLQSKTLSWKIFKGSCKAFHREASRVSRCT